MNGAFSRRTGIGAAGAIAVAIVLSGCSGSDAGNEPPALSEEPVTIGITWWGGDARADLTQQAIDAFEAEHPNITVEPQYADWAGYWDQLATTTAAGDAPDVIQMDELYLSSYGERGALYNASELEVDTSQIDPDALSTGVVADQQLALPIGVAVYSVVANADLFEKYGVELPDDETWTWEDYAAKAKELTDKSGGEITGSAIVGGWDAGSVKYWARSNDNELFDAEGNVTLDPANLAKMWQFQLDMIEEGGMQTAPEIVESQTAGISASALATNKVGLGLAYNAQIAAYADASGADMQLLKLPQPEGVDANFYKPSMYWSVASRSEHPAEAALLVDYLLNNENAAGIIKTERGIPANASILEQLTPELTPNDQKAVEYQERVTPGASPAVTPAGGSGVEAILQRYTQEVLAGQTQPQDAAEAFIKELQGEIDAA